MPRARILGLAALLAIPFAPAAVRAAAPSRIVFSADLTPRVTGEIYRLDPNGRLVDLSRSPALDIDPVVSSDGKTVAFLSDRSGREGVYEIGVDGRGLERVAPNAHLGSQTFLAWQPHGSELAIATTGDAESTGHVWIARPHGDPILAARRARLGTFVGFGVQQPWSPDGRILLVADGSDAVRAVSPQGRTLWTARTDRPFAAWSSRGLLATPLPHGAAVYDESGRQLFRFRLPSSFAELVWSPGGVRLAALSSGNPDSVEVRSAGGALELERRVGFGNVGWANDSTVVVGFPGCPACGKTVGIDVRTGKAKPTSNRWLDPLSPDRRLAIVASRSKPGFSLGVGRPGGGPLAKYASIGGCLGDGVLLPAASSLQFAGRSRSIVYQSGNDCDDPFANLYSVAPDGSGLQRLTDTQAQETQPAISPDGSEVAYVWADANGLSCKGCSDGIRVVSADGSGGRTLTDPEDCTFDDSPTWSPDGSTILFSETGCDSPGELWTVQAGGGPAHDLRVAGTQPAWGPSRIAYVGSSGVWTANPDGSDPEQVSSGGGDPAWSEDGRLAYRTGRLGTIVVVGSRQTQLPFASVTSLAWSPDGTRFVVTARVKKTAPLDVYTVRTDGTDPIRVTTDYGALGADWR